MGARRNQRITKVFFASTSGGTESGSRLSLTISCLPSMMSLCSFIRKVATSSGVLCLRKHMPSRFNFLLFVCWLKKEGNVLFNDALNTFYLRLYGIIHMVKDHSDCEGGNPLPPHGLLIPISRKVFYMHHPTDRITHTMAFVTPIVEHWLEWEIAQCVHPMKDRSDDISPWANALTMELHLPLCVLIYYK